MIGDLAVKMSGGLAERWRVRQYSGFGAGRGWSGYELGIRTIFLEFASKKNKVLGQFVEAHFERLNGRIKLANLKDDYVRRFGPSYVKRFIKLLDVEEANVLRASGASMRSSYGNLIEWRHEFAHKGSVTNATFAEVVASYALGKKLIGCLAAAMVR